ncbi:MAG: hypothetical protein WKG07_40075 [Hymenobacter sp.]
MLGAAIRLSRGCARALAIPLAQRLDGEFAGLARRRAAHWSVIQLPEGKRIRVLTDRFDLTCAVGGAVVTKNGGRSRTGWKWLKAMYKIKGADSSRSAAALPVPIVGAFVTDVVLRAFIRSGFTGSLYEFVTRCQEMKSRRG